MKKILAVITVLSFLSCQDNSTETIAEYMYTYSCEEDVSVQASYSSDSTAVILYMDDEYSLSRAASASGARYIGDGLEWWTRGTGPGADGMLSEMNNETGTHDILTHCKQQ